MATPPNPSNTPDGRRTELVCEVAPPPAPGRDVIEGQDYSTTLHLLAQLAAARPAAPATTQAK